MRLGIAVAREEGLKVALGDAHNAPSPMRHQIAGLDPAAHCAGGDSKTLRNLGDGEEPHFIDLVRR